MEAGRRGPLPDGFGRRTSIGVPPRARQDVDPAGRLPRAGTRAGPRGCGDGCTCLCPLDFPAAGPGRAGCCRAGGGARALNVNTRGHAGHGHEPRPRSHGGVIQSTTVKNREERDAQHRLLSLRQSSIAPVAATRPFRILSARQPWCPLENGRRASRARHRRSIRLRARSPTHRPSPVHPAPSHVADPGGTR